MYLGSLSPATRAQYQLAPCSPGWKPGAI